VFSLAELDPAMTPDDLIRRLKRDLKYERLFTDEETVFFSQPFTCFRCHNEFTMSGGVDFEGREVQGADAAKHRGHGPIHARRQHRDVRRRGIGHDKVTKNRSVRGFALTADQRTDVLAFLNSLTDDALLHDPRFADRWTQAAQETR
jgi:hypothetical protein